MLLDQVLNNHRLQESRIMMNDSESTTEPQTHQSHSTLKDFLASIATISGDLSNITAPPFVLDTKSVVELPAFWAERPALFAAPADSSDPADRALRVLRWFLASLKNQQYGGRSEEESVKKPLNAFLGECFLARWEDDSGVTTLVSEQVSHHPPVTACRLWNEEKGVVAEGFTRQEMTLNLGSIAIRQTGHALLTLKNHGDETYLIPLPDVKLKNMISGLSGAYPELQGSYTIPCTSGYYSVVDFSGKSLLGGGNKNEFVAKLHAPGNSEDPLYTVTGRWTDSFTTYKGNDTSESAATETLVLKDLPTVPLKLLEEDLEAQDPWESRRAWRQVRDALARGDMSGTAKAKSVLEQGQRDMRKDEEESGKKWETLFFKPHKEDAVAASLYRSILKELSPDDTVAIWKFDEHLWNAGWKKPFHGALTPDNKNVQEAEAETETETTGAKMPPRNQHLLVSGGSRDSDDDDDLASPASFQTAHEYMPRVATPTNGAGDSALQGPARIASKLAQAQAQRPVTPVRESIDPPPSTGKANTPSSESLSPSSRRGKRQRARESIGKLKSSLSSGFSKIGSSPGRTNGD